MPNTAIRLVYRSKSCISHDDVAALDIIFLTANRNNNRDKITGCLALPDGHFVQVIEGNQINVSRLMERIQADGRHENIIILDRRPVSSRLFPAWSMARPDPTPLSDQSFRIITEDGSGVQVTAILLGLTQKTDYWFPAI